MGLNHTKNLRILFKKSLSSALGRQSLGIYSQGVQFCKAPFFVVPYLSILGGVFVMCHFCKVPLFSHGFKGCFFCWVPFFGGVSDGAFLFCFSFYG